MPWFLCRSIGCESWFARRFIWPHRLCTWWLMRQFGGGTVRAPSRIRRADMSWEFGRAEAAETWCVLGHKTKAMECPSCCGSTDLAWWKWYRSRTSSRTVKAAIDTALASGALDG